MTTNKLDQLRKKVDRIDRDLLGSLNRRSEIVLKIGKIKKESHKEIYAPGREKAVLGRLAKNNRGPFPEHALRAVFREILSASRALQSPLKVCYFGPEASFTNLAALKHFGRSTELIPEGAISKVFDAVEHDRAQYGVVPIENSTEGMVGATLDGFIDSTVKIVAEITMPISHHLMSRSGSLKGSNPLRGLNPFKGVRKIYSFPQATGQCRGWLEQNMPHLPIIEAESTARAAERAAEDPESAAIAGEHAAEIYGLKILKRHIEDSPNNMTRFLVIGKKSPLPAAKRLQHRKGFRRRSLRLVKEARPVRSGQDKTSVLFSVKDEAGILYRMLEPFYRNRINLTKIESRPLKKKAWEYIFFLDMDGHYEEKKVREAIRGLDKRCLFLKLLGSYPKATA